MGFSTTLGPNGWQPVDTQNAEYAAAVVGAAGVSITEAALLTTTGETNLLYVVSDGDNRGAKIVWAVPDGASVATWCWWLWPQASYF